MTADTEHIHSFRPAGTIPTQVTRDGEVYLRFVRVSVCDACSKRDYEPIPGAEMLLRDWEAFLRDSGTGRR